MKDENPIWHQKCNLFAWVTVVLIFVDVFSVPISTNPSWRMNHRLKEHGQAAKHEQVSNLFYSKKESYNPRCLIVLVAFHLFYIICLETLHLPLGWTLWISREISKELNLPKYHTQSCLSTTKAAHCILTVKDLGWYAAAIDYCWFHFSRCSSYFLGWGDNRSSFSPLKRY